MQRWATLILAAAGLHLGLATTGCGDADASEPTADAGDAVDSGTQIPGIAPAMLPQMGPCPPGWIAEQRGEAEVCTPPAALEEACPNGFIQRIGDTECTPLGAPCPTGEFADELPAGTIYVRAGTDSSGSGTREDPFRTIASAMRAVRPGGVVALSKGTFDETVVVDAPISLVGACATETILRGTATIDPVVRVYQTHDVTIEDLSIDAQNETMGLLSQLSGCTLRNLEVRDSRMGIVFDGSEATLDSVRSRHSSDSRESDFGIGLLATGSTRVSGQHVYAEDNVRGFVAEAGASFVLEDSRAVRSVGRGTQWGVGFDADGTGTRIELRNSECVSSHGVAVLASNSAHVELDGVVVRDVKEMPPPATFGYGIAAVRGTVVARRVAVLNARVNGIRGQARSMLQLEDVLIDTIEPGQDLALAAGLATSSSAQLSRVYISKAGGIGLLGSDADLQGNDIVVTDTRMLNERVGNADGLGMGLIGTADFERVRIERNAIAGIMVRNSESMSRVNIRDLVVLDMSSSAEQGLSGMAVTIYNAVVSVERAHIERTREAAITAYGQNAELELRDVHITDAMARPCANDTCANSPGGHGVGSYMFASLRADNLEIDGAALCGVQVATNGRLELTGGSIRNSEVGLCVQVEGFELERALNGVEFEGNGIAVDQNASHSVPEPPQLDLGSL